ncbi:MAG: hypothetical protein Q8P67_26450 [archaeon]|nr:hypothetical protein [archaeon]
MSSSDQEVSQLSEELAVMSGPSPTSSSRVDPADTMVAPSQAQAPDGVPPPPPAAPAAKRAKPKRAKKPPKKPMAGTQAEMPLLPPCLPITNEKCGPHCCCPWLCCLLSVGCCRCVTFVDDKPKRMWTWWCIRSIAADY